MGTILALLALAVSPGARTIDATANGATIIVNGLPIHEVLTSAGGLSPVQRAERIVEVLLSVDDQAAFTEQQGEYWLVKMDDQVVLTVTVAEALASETTRLDLATAVASRINRAAALGPLDIDPERIELSPGKSAGVSLLGYAARRAEVTVTPSDVCDVVQGDWSLRITGRLTGEAVVTVKAGSATRTLAVRVAPPAGELPDSVEAIVLGRPADASLVAATIRSAVMARIRAGAGASVQFISESGTPQLVPSQRTTMNPLVMVSAPGRLTTSREVAVNVKNVGAEAFAEAELWYSNHPEQVTAPQRLYWAKLEPGPGARLLYHHRNRSSRPMVMQFVLANTGDEEVRVAISMGESDPVENPTLAGYQAGEMYLKRWAKSSAAVATVPAHSMVPLSIRRLGPSETMSGLCTLRLIGDSGSLLLIGDAFWAADIDQQWKDAASAPHAWASILPRKLHQFPMNLTGQRSHVYPDPTKRIDVTYETGGQFGFVRFGQDPIGRGDAVGSLAGNFGVVYKVMVRMVNTTSSPVEIVIEYEASAGYGGAVFRIDGLAKRTRMLQPKQSEIVARYFVQPGQQKVVTLESIPLSGGSYPTTLTIRPAGVR